MVSLPLVIVGEQSVGLGMSRLISENFLGPAQALFRMTVLEELARGIILMVQVARGCYHLLQELLDMLTFLFEPG